MSYFTSNGFKVREPNRARVSKEVEANPLSRHYLEDVTPDVATPS